jgi:hypothetical protein
MLRYNYFKCAAKDGFIEPIYRKSEDLLADIRTKALTGTPFWKRWKILKGLGDLEA